MLLVRLSEDLLVLQQFLNLGEQGLLLVVVVRLHEFVPRQTIANKVGLVRISYVGGLVVDGIVAAENSVVEQRHVCRTGGEEICL